MKNIPLSLYIHTPWCTRKCPYCDFNSHPLRAELPEDSYAQALLADFKSHLITIQDRPIHTIFIGGGTPSLLSPRFYETLFQQLKTYVTIPHPIEITLEANPGTVEQSRFQDYRDIGINRLSLGIQSFQANKLKKLGRIHDDTEAIQAVVAVKNAGFTNFNLDLMYGLPDQTIADALFDLQTALALQPTHLSWYQLTLEPNTYFHRFPPTLPSEEWLWEIQETGHAYLTQSGLEHYEVSAYCQSDYRCQHNVNYWEFGDYLGIGAGAHSKITDYLSGKINRHWNVKNPKDYLNPHQSCIAGQSTVSATELPLEFMMNALRLQNPVSTHLMLQRTGLTMADMQAQLQHALEKDFLSIENDSFHVTPWGKRYLNELLEIFV